MRCILYVIRYVIFCFRDEQINPLCRSSPPSLIALRVRSTATRSRDRFSRLRHTRQPKNLTLLLPSTNAQQYSIQLKIAKSLFRRHRVIFVCVPSPPTRKSFYAPSTVDVSFMFQVLLYIIFIILFRIHFCIAYDRYTLVFNRSRFLRHVSRLLRGGDFGVRASNRSNHRRACERACARECSPPSSTHHRRPTGCKRRMTIMDTSTWEVDGVGTVVVALSSLLFVFLFVLAAVLGCRRPITGLSGPTAYPIIGTLHAMDGHRDNPFRRFTELARLYGPVYAMTMGSMPCVIVNDYPSIKEVLITNGSKFGGRPNFFRYNVLFAGDRNNCEYIV